MPDIFATGDFFLVQVNFYAQIRTMIGSFK